ncbi:CU044_2847 family protein [Streptomyces sp. AM8-1-1]|uniref:CU044_2847 family protein n=1 Tax=Streptomyces sp. AM8-1-1 TaxID=3075825 RepID=UPI0028C4F0AA|nr:CU044_2847 family protein [Streptomyces sp. AM8-1-1]WNO70402.1 CU044_2847 family protein [Streptomyces sp. AM8-1-1]
MSDLVQAMMPDGTAMWVRVTDDEEGPRDTGFGDAVSRRLDDLSGTLDTVTRTVRAGLRNAAPDEVALEFGIEVAAKSGKLVSVLTETGGKATLKVTVTWRKGQPTVTTVTPTGQASESEAEAEDGEAGADRAGGTV